MELSVPAEELLIYKVEQPTVGKNPGFVHLFFSPTAAAPIQPLTLLAYVASGSTGPLRTVAVDLFRIEPRDPAYRHPYPPDMPRPRPGSAWMLELNRTSLLLPTRRLKAWSKDGLRQLKVEAVP